MDTLQKINHHGINLIKSFEGLKLKAYYCSSDILTIGWGHTGDVSSDQEITIERANQLFLADIKWAEEAVRKYTKIKLDDNQFSALVSFCFNVGGPRYRSSNLLKTLNLGQTEEALKILLLWRRSKGKIKRGLVRRRNAEKALFLSDIQLMEKYLNDK